MAPLVPIVGPVSGTRRIASLKSRVLGGVLALLASAVLLPGLFHAGGWTPLILMAGRRHGMLKLDFYDNEIGNKNFCMAGTSGAGKSQTLNLIAEAYASTGSKVWIVEPGNSFMRLCQICNGQMIHFGTHGKRPRINPFSWVRDIKEDMQMLLPMASKMASPKADLLDVQYKALGAMIMQLYSEYGAEMTVTAIRDRFKARVMNSELEDMAGASMEDQRFMRASPPPRRAR